MDSFTYHNDILFAEGISLGQLAEAAGTPFYCYSHAHLVGQIEAFDGSFRDLPHLTCYSVKANSNLAVLAIMARRGLGFDIVSGGELARCLAAGAAAGKIVYSGVGKTWGEMRAALVIGQLFYFI